MDTNAPLKPVRDVPPYLGVSASLSGRGWRERIAANGVSPETLREITHRLGLMNVAEADFVEPLARFAAGSDNRAIAVHPTGRYFWRTGQRSAAEAEEAALNACNEDRERNRRDGPCLLYASGNQVVLPERRRNAAPR